MRIIWPHKLSIRSFHSPLTSRITAVSSNLAEKATVISFADQLFITIDESDRFCDFELNLEATRRSEASVNLTGVPRITSEIELLLEENSQPSCFFDEFSRYLHIAFSTNEAEQWKQLGDQDTFLGILDDRFLKGLVLVGVKEDPMGDLEERWLDEIEE